MLIEFTTSVGKKIAIDPARIVCIFAAVVGVSPATYIDLGDYREHDGGPFAVLGSYEDVRKRVDEAVALGSADLVVGGLTSAVVALRRMGVLR